MYRMKHVREAGIAVIGDELFVRSTRLLGASRTLVVDRSLSENEVLRVIKGFMEGLSDIGLIVVQESLRPLFEQLDEGMAMPKIVYLPDIRNSGNLDVRRYYLELLKRYIGLSLEV